MSVKIIDIAAVSGVGGWPGGGSGSGRHWNSGSASAAWSVAVNPGDALDLSIWDDSGQANGAYGDGGGGRYHLYTGPTLNQVGGAQLATTGLKSGYFGSAHLTGTVPSGHYFAWVVFQDNIWYREIELTVTAGAYVSGLNFNNADGQAGWPGSTGGGGTSRHYNGGSTIATSPSYAITAGDAINQDDFSDNSHRPYGDGGGGNWFIYTGPTSDQIGGSAQFSSGSFGGYWSGVPAAFIVPAGHNYLWFGWQNNIWYESITVTRSPAPAGGGGGGAKSQGVIIL